jgi:hypothetical protein
VIKDALLQNVSDPWVRTRLEEEDSQTRTHSSSSAEQECVDISYIYPILQQKLSQLDTEKGEQSSSSGSKQSQRQQQPQAKLKKKKTSSGSGSGNGGYVPWAHSPAVLKFSFHGDNPLSTFLDNAWGSVLIPVRELAQEQFRHDEGEDVPGVQPEVRVWKDIIWTSAHLQVVHPILSLLLFPPHLVLCCAVL